MRQREFIIPMLLLAGACNAPSAGEPASSVGKSSTSIAVDSTWAEAPADGVSDRGASPITMRSGG